MSKITGGIIMSFKKKLIVITAVSVCILVITFGVFFWYPPIPQRVNRFHN